MARTIRETCDEGEGGDVYFLLTRDRGTIIRNSVFAAVIGAVWVLLGGIVYAASWSLLSWTLIIPGVISWAAVQYVYTVAKLGLRIHSNGNSNSSAVEILRVGRKCVIDKCRIDDVVVAEKTPDGREKRDAGDCKYFLALKLLDTDAWMTRVAPMMTMAAREMMMIMITVLQRRRRR